MKNKHIECNVILYNSLQHNTVNTMISKILTCFIICLTIGQVPVNAQVDPITAMEMLSVGINSMVGSFEKIASLFSTSSKSQIIGTESCLGFDSFAENTTVQVIECLPDAQVAEFVSDYFDDLLWIFNGDVDKMTAELLVWDYAHATNWSSNIMKLTNNASSVVNVKQIIKNHNDTNACSNWVILEYSGVFELAPDLIIWQNTKSSWGGFDTSVTDVIQQVPHNISPQDVEAIYMLFEIFAFGSLASDQGLNFTYPTLPSCKQNVSLADPSVGDMVVASMKQFTDSEINSLPSTPPAFQALLSNVVGLGAYDFAQVSPADVKTVEQSWQTANNWPNDVIVKFDAMIFNATTEDFESFAFAYQNGNAEWIVVFGSARNFNNTVTMAYTSAIGQGTTIQQYWGNDHSVLCSSIVNEYTSVICTFPQPPGCGFSVPCSSCAYNPQMSPITVRINFGCGTIMTNTQMTASVSGYFTPGSCRPLGSACIPNPPSPPSYQTVDFSSCRNPNSFSQCARPFTSDEINTIVQTLEYYARQQIPAQMNLLAEKLSVSPLPYPSQ